MSRSILLPVAVPLLGAAFAALIAGRSILVQRITGFLVLSFMVVYAGVLVGATRDGSVLVSHVGGWPAGFAISFAADLLAALMLLVTAVMMLVCTAFAALSGDDRRGFFHPLVLVLGGGVGGAFLTADVFNLFVFFEVMLIASYVLLTLGGSRMQVRAGTVYVTTNLLASTIFVAAVALLYGSVGTVNMASLALADVTTGPPAVAGALLLVAFGVKASLVPVHGWLPQTYPAAPPAVAALFSGLLSKVGVYAIYRMYSLMWGADNDARTILLVIAVVTMIVGVLGAVGRDGMRDILSFHMVSQVGYLIAAVALFTPMALAAGIFYTVQYIAVKTSLFLSAGSVEVTEGSGRLASLGGIARRRPVVAVAFMLAALALAGLPPFSGFFAKLLLIRAAFEVESWLLAATAVGVSFLTLMSMIKIWIGAFWGEDTTTSPGAARAGAGRLAIPGLVLAGLALGIGLWAEPLYELTSVAAAGLVDPTPYIEAVLQR